MKIFKFLMSVFIVIVLVAIAIPAKSPPAQHSAVNSVNVPAKNSALEIPSASVSERGVYPDFYAANLPKAVKKQRKAKEKILTKYQKLQQPRRPPDVVKLE